MEADSEKKLPEYAWMVRPCEIYKEEYSDCTQMGARFHQYFVFGQSVDCSRWKEDHNNCMRWRDKEDVSALEKVIASEKQRLLDRLSPHVNNDVWEHRTQPPEDWNKPLPEWLQKANEGTYLFFKAKEVKENKMDVDDGSTFCVLM